MLEREQPRRMRPDPGGVPQWQRLKRVSELSKSLEHVSESLSESLKRCGALVRRVRRLGSLGPTSRDAASDWPASRMSEAIKGWIRVADWLPSIFSMYPSR